MKQQELSASCSWHGLAVSVGFADAPSALPAMPELPHLEQHREI